MVGHNNHAIFWIASLILGKCLSNLTYVHPVFKDQRLLFLHSDHTSLKGTGLVHTAPAHGPEDFLVGLQYNLQAVSNLFTVVLKQFINEKFKTS